MGKIKNQNVTKQLIREVLVISLDNILLEINFNVENGNKKQVIQVKIDDNGESIIINQRNLWINKNDFNDQFYSIQVLNEENNFSELSRLLFNKIEKIQYGIGKELYTPKAVVYYFLLKTNNHQFLFFNNGDEGKYKLDDFSTILKNDIYEYEWRDDLPTILL